MSFRIVASTHQGAEERRFEVLGIPGPTLLEQLQAASVPIKSSCQGKGICRQCRVQVRRGIAPITPSDRKSFKEDLLAHGWRLSCGIRPKTAIEVTFPQTYLFQTDVTWLRAPVSDYSWACDFGTTGVEISAVDRDGEFVRAKGLNRQVVRGADIMTRLEYAQNNGVEPLFEIAEEQIAKMLGLLRDEIGRRGFGGSERPGDNALTSKTVPVNNSFSEHPRLAIAGNSAVSSFLAKLPIESLATSPYQPASLTEQTFPLAGTEAITLPLLNSFVGGDLFAGLFHLWSKRADFPKLYGGAFEEPWILMDVGTNSEILLYDGERLFVASTPAGPAFEGSNISIGMRAEHGAIKNPRFDATGAERSNGPDAGRWKFDVIGSDLPKGICGSALVQAVDEAVAAELVNADGEVLRSDAIPFTSALTLNQDDFREFQLAKSAIRTGLDLVAREARAPTRRLFLAGAFGEHLPLAASRRMGLLPDLETHALGNASLKGIVAWIHASDEERSGFKSWLEKTKFPIELALSDEFQARFIDNLTLRPATRGEPTKGE